MIDWTKPLELMDGTPVRPYYSNATGWPDEDGQYHVTDDTGHLVGLFDKDGSLHHYPGVSEDTKLRVRNRDEAPTKTLRDEFAMAALTGLCSHPDYYDRTWAEIAETAEGQADAMMEARK